MARQDPQFKLRMPDELHERISAAATEAGRSMNAEIVRRLERSLTAEPPANAPDLSAALARVSAEIAALQVALRSVKT